MARTVGVARRAGGGVAAVLTDVALAREVNGSRGSGAGVPDLAGNVGRGRVVAVLAGVRGCCVAVLAIGFLSLIHI